MTWESVGEHIKSIQEQGRSEPLQTNVCKEDEGEQSRMKSVPITKQLAYRIRSKSSVCFCFLFCSC